MANDYINQMNMKWNRKIETVQGTVVADILEGLWEICEDIYYDKLADRNCYDGWVDSYKDNPEWYS